MSKSSKIPDGWRLVPIEPTREMVEAYFGKTGLRMLSHVGREWTESAVKLQGTHNEPGFLKGWRAMVRAAPEPPK